MTRILAIIPARGGSKGVFRKNLVNVCGKPLIAWTIDAALNSDFLTEVFVSSEDEEILNVSISLGAVPLQRPMDLADDHSSSESVVQHALMELKQQGKNYDYVMLLQPTSPLRTSADIDCAIEMVLEDAACDGIISVCAADNKVLKSFILSDRNKLTPVSHLSYLSRPRQDLPEVVQTNGAIYLIKVQLFEEKLGFVTPNIKPFLMSADASLDIDVSDDITNVEAVMLKQFASKFA